MTANSNRLQLTETRGGMYNSTPTAEHVLTMMTDRVEGEEILASYADNGHGEYCQNVHATVEYCRAHGLTTLDEIQQAINEAEVDTN